MPRQLRHSVTSIQTFEKCPRRWHYQYVERVKPPVTDTPFHWRKGRVIHAGLEAAFDIHKRGRGELPASMDHYFEHAEAAARNAWHKEQMGETEGSDWHDTLRQIGLSLAEAGVPNRRDVLGVEHRWTVDLLSGIPWLAFADLVLGLSRDTVLIRDWKSNAQVQSPQVLADDFQLAVYGILVRRTWPSTRTVYASHFHTPLGQENRVLISPGVQGDAQARIEAMVEMMDAAQERTAHAAVLPKTRKGPACTTCPFKAQCPEWDTPQTDEFLAIEGF